jgi:hypothetical protein
MMFQISNLKLWLKSQNTVQYYFASYRKIVVSFLFELYSTMEQMFKIEK